jgi:N-acetylmuramoyl-L-alanine amidase
MPQATACGDHRCAGSPGHARRSTVLAVAALLVATLALVVQPAPAGAGVRLIGVRTRQSAKAADKGRPVDASLFEPSACQEFSPTSGNKHLTVFLDAGHGGIDPGGVGQDENGNTIYEADETLPVELDTMGLLRAKGYTVVVSRTENTTVSRPQPDDLDEGVFTAQGVHDDVAARDTCANMAKANVLVGIYFDAGGSSYDAGCVTAYDSVRPFASQNLKLATLVQNDVLNALNAQGWQIPNLGVTNDSELGGPPLTAAAGDYGHLLLLGPADPGWFNSPSRMPGALIEPLFITDPFEANIAESPSGQQVIAGGLAQAVEQYFDPAPAGDNTEAAAPSRHKETATRPAG